MAANPKSGHTPGQGPHSGDAGGSRASRAAPAHISVGHSFRQSGRDAGGSSAPRAMTQQGIGISGGHCLGGGERSGDAGGSKDKGARAVARPARRPPGGASRMQEPQMRRAQGARQNPPSPLAIVIATSPLGALLAALGGGQQDLTGLSAGGSPS